MQYTQTGTWISVAGIVTTSLAYFGISIDASSIVTYIGDVVKVVGDVAIVYGIIHQAIAHKALAQAAGAIPKR